MKSLWSCFLPLDLLSAYDIYDLPELPQWLSLLSYDSLGTLGCMAISVLILFFSAPNGKRGRLPRVLFVRLPSAKKIFPVRLLLYALEAALLVFLLVSLKIASITFYDCIGNFFDKYEPLRETLRVFIRNLSYYLPDYIGTDAPKIPIVFILEILVREFQVYVYNRKTAHPEAETDHV
ncbi:MAG: hypothetical protein J6S92_13815 [Oscillospiraceae bacterium]|nr:hypothetical protein [Oscillospiraceae bacterium]